MVFTVSFPRLCSPLSYSVYLPTFRKRLLNGFLICTHWRILESTTAVTFALLWLKYPTEWQRWKESCKVLCVRGSVMEDFISWNQESESEQEPTSAATSKMSLQWPHPLVVLLPNLHHLQSSHHVTISRVQPVARVRFSYLIRSRNGNLQTLPQWCFFSVLCIFQSSRVDSQNQASQYRKMTKDFPDLCTKK